MSRSANILATGRILFDEEINVEPGIAPTTTAGSAVDHLGGELEHVEAGGRDVRVVADDVSQVTVPYVHQLAVSEWVGVGGSRVRGRKHARLKLKPASVSRGVVREEEPVAKLESLELASYETAKCGTNIGPRQLILEETSSEQINVTRRVVEGGKPLPDISRNVAWRLIPCAGPLQTTCLGNESMKHICIHCLSSLGVPYFSELIVARKTMLTTTLQVSDDKISCPLEVLKQSHSEVRHHVGIHGLSLFKLKTIENSITVCLIECVIEEVLLQSEL